jgi:hypothetical protein
MEVVMRILTDIGWTLAVVAGITGTAMVVIGMFDDLLVIIRARSRHR